MAFDINTAKPINTGFDISTAKPVDEQADSPSIAKSAALGTAQGVTMGFGDEGAGLLQVAAKGLHDIAMGKKPDLSMESYRNFRDIYRNSFDKAHESNPKTYMGGEIVGSLAPALIPGFQGSSAGTLTTMGALQGLGNSTADLTKGDFAGAAKDTVTGAALGLAGGKLIPATLKTAMKAPAWLAKKATSTILGPSIEAIDAYLRNPGAIKGASIKEIAQGLPEVADKLTESIKTNIDKARETLSTSSFIEPSKIDKGGAFAKDEILGMVASARNKLGGLYTKGGKQAAKTLDAIASDLNKLRNTVSQSNVQSLINKIDDEINWDKVIRTPEALSAEESGMVSIRNKLSQELKIKNPEYAQAMKPVEDAIDTRTAFARNFGLKKIKGGSYTPSDQAVGKLDSALKEGKIETQRIMDKVKEITGTDLVPKVQNAKYAQEFVGGRTNGSRNVNTMAILSGLAGGATGGVMGSPGIGGGVGAAVGAATGAYIDKKGGAMAANMLDKYLASKAAASNVGSTVAKYIPDILKANPSVFQNYAPLLKRAATLGGQQVALQHWLLMESDPEYKKIVGAIESKGE